MRPADFKVIGQSIPRLDAVDQVTGKTVYAVDMKLPRMLCGKVLRSKLAHAKIISVDTSKAEQLPGVEAICTHKDFAYSFYGFSRHDQPILAVDKVRYQGEPILAIAAETEDIAKEALKLVEIKYEELPAVMEPEEALKPDAAKIHDDGNLVIHMNFVKGNIDEGFKEADLVIEETVFTPIVEHAHLEPHCAIAEYTSLGEYNVWTSTQRPFTLADSISRCLKIPQSKITLKATNVGGGFGGKNEMTIEPVAMILAKKAKRPVKIEYTREEEFNASTTRHGYRLTYKTGVKKDGTLVARYVDIVSDCGAYVGWGQWTLQKAGVFAAGPYDTPHVKVDGRLVYTNKTMGGAMRGFGTPQVGFAYEYHMDTIARKLGMDPLELRLKNIIKDGSVTLFGQVLQNVNLESVLKRVTEKAGWSERSAQK